MCCSTPRNQQHTDPIFPDMREATDGATSTGGETRRLHLHYRAAAGVTSTDPAWHGKATGVAATGDGVREARRRR